MNAIDTASSIRRLRKRAPTLPGAVIDRLIVEVLGQTRIPLSAYDLAARIEAARGVRSVVPIYRSLDRLTGQQVIERVESASAYRLRDLPKPLLMICTQCGCAASISVAADHDQLRTVLVGAGFDTQRLVVEAIGVCSLCRAQRGTTNETK